MAQLRATDREVLVLVTHVYAPWLDLRVGATTCTACGGNPTNLKHSESSSLSDTQRQASGFNLKLTALSTDTGMPSPSQAAPRESSRASSTCCQRPPVVGSTFPGKGWVTSRAGTHLRRPTHHRRWARRRGYWRGPAEEGTRFPPGLRVHRWQTHLHPRVHRGAHPLDLPPERQRGRSQRAGGPRALTSAGPAPSPRSAGSAGGSGQRPGRGLRCLRAGGACRAGRHGACGGGPRTCHGHAVV
jgi:hypothetical protein